MYKNFQSEFQALRGKFNKIEMICNWWKEKWKLVYI